MERNIVCEAVGGWTLEMVALTELGMGMGMELVVMDMVMDMAMDMAVMMTGVMVMVGYRWICGLFLANHSRSSRA